MNKPAKVLFITAPIGSGHIRAAEAVSEALKSLDPDITTTIANVFDFFSRFLGQSLLKIYLKILDVFPCLYGKLYGWGNNSKLALLGRECISRFLARRMLRYIQDYSPTLIVCTHATPAGLVAQLKKQGSIHIPAVAVVTDFVVHRLWIYNEIDYYFVASDEMQTFLSDHQIMRSCSSVSGIPVHASFAQTVNKQETIAALTLDSSIRTVLIMGGGAGILPMREIVLSFNELKLPLQIIAVTGNNVKLYEELQNLKQILTYKIRILPFVSNIHELMAVADILITKPGGMTSAEALSVGVPLIIYRPIPGQEEGNTKYLLSRRAARRADSVSELIGIVNELLTKSDILGGMRMYSRQLGHPDAAKKISTEIFVKYLS
jgi:processive 1,2-diacylglycerol beta-glucosyltransferase